MTVQPDSLEQWTHPIAPGLLVSSNRQAWQACRVLLQLGQLAAFLMSQIWHQLWRCPARLAGLVCLSVLE